MSLELFIIKWEIVGETATVLGFSNCDRCIRIVNFKNYAYIEKNVHVMQEIHNNDLNNNRKRFTTTPLRFIREAKPALVNRIEFSRKKHTIQQEKKIYETDVDILLKFLSDKGLDYVGWIRTEKFVRTKKRITTCRDEYIVLLDDLHTPPPEKRNTVPDVSILSFDIECYSKNRGMSDARNPEDKIFMISMIFFKHSDKTSFSSYVLALSPSQNAGAAVEKKTTKFRCEKKKKYTTEYFLEEFELLEEFFRKIRQKNPSLIIGYNIMGFDIKYIVNKYYSLLKNIPTAGKMLTDQYARDKIISKSWSSAAYGIVETVIFDFIGRCCFDIFGYLKMQVPMQKYSLDYVSKEILGERKVDMPYNVMFRMYEEGHIPEIAEYCFVDSYLTVKLWFKLNIWYSIVEESRLFKVHIHELYSGGQQKKIFNQLYYYSHRKGFVFDKAIDEFKREFEYQGATVLQPKPGIYTSCGVIDFASLYPSIIISENLCYTTYQKENNAFTKSRKGILPLILEHLIEERKKIKTLMRKEKDEIMRVIYDKRQFAYKVSTNSFYGAFGSRDSHYLQLVPAAKMVTQRGRELLEEAVRFVNTHPLGCQVIYGDTDSCFFIKRNSSITREEVEIIVEGLNAILPSPIKLEFEKLIDKILLLAKKKYIYTEGKETKSKGVITAKRDTCLWVKELYGNIIDMILRGSSNLEVNQYLYREIKKLYLGDVSLDSLYINKNLGTSYKLENFPLNIFSKVLADAERRTVHPGERLEYYFIRSDNKYQGYKMATKYMIENHGLEIDHDYYLKHQLLSPLLQIYEAVKWRFTHI